MTSFFLDKKKFLILFIFFSLSFGFCDNWVLASQKFTFKQKGVENGPNRQISTVLPQLILEQITEDGFRTLSAQEELDRILYDLQTKRLSLFLQLSKEYKTRDSLVLLKDKPSELKKNILLEEKKIKEIEEQIDENIQQVIEVNKKYENRLNVDLKKDIQNEKNQNGFFQLPFFKRNETEKSSTESIVLYKNDSSQLYTPGKNAEDGGLFSFEFNKDVVSAKINGLLNGEISIYGEYLSVTVSLYIFPGAKLSATVTEVGSTNDLISIAQNISKNLIPKIANSLPVKIELDIEPLEVAPYAEVSIDGVIAGNLNDIVFDAGIHTITISSPGYESQTITYSFSGEDIFIVKTTLKPLVTGFFDIKLAKPVNGTFFFNAMESSKVDNENIYGKASVNGRSVLGSFTDDNKNSAFFYVPQEIAQNEKNLSVKLNPYSREKNIDKRRRALYTSYSALICSLIPTFYCVGNFTAANNSYADGRTSYENMIKWQRYSYYTIGISCVAGTWFGVEIFRYLHAANDVLPETAKINK